MKKNMDRMAFRREYILLPDGTPFGQRMDDWQEEDFRALDSDQHRHSYLERPRGHSKTFDMGAEAATEMVLGPPRQNLYGLAADEEQGELLFADVVGIFQRHPALRGLVKATAKTTTVKATGTCFHLLNSNAPTIYGLRPDWIGVDELVEHRRPDAWLALWTASGKRPGCKVRVITTAGWDPSHFARGVRENAEREPSWYFSARGQCASWISHAWLEEQRRTLPAHVFARLHESRWVDGVGAFLTAAEVDSVFAAMPAAPAGARALGLDLGLTRDKTVVAEVARDAATGLVCVEALVTWDPKGRGKVELPEVEEDVVALAQRFRCGVWLDPWQGVLLGQRLQQRGVQVVEFPFTGDNRRKLFITLLDLVRANRLRARPHDELRRELLSLETTETAAGWRVDHKPGRFDDHVVAVGLAVQGLPAWTGGSAWGLAGPPPPADPRLVQAQKETRLADAMGRIEARTRRWALDHDY